MRKYQIEPDLQSYAAVLSCLGNMDLFDSKIARRIILDIEKQVGQVESVVAASPLRFHPELSCSGYLQSGMSQC